MTISFTLKQKPQAKQRPRFNSKTKAVYTPQATKDYETSIAWAYKQAKGQLLDGAVAIEIHAYFEPPKSDRYGHMLIGLIDHIKRPDVDNLAKAVLDGLNGVAFKDDSHVVSLHITKAYSEYDHIDVSVQEVL